MRGFCSVKGREERSGHWSHEVLAFQMIAFQARRVPDQITEEDGPRRTLLQTTFEIQGSGYLRCSANNSIGDDEDVALIVAIGKSTRRL